MDAMDHCNGALTAMERGYCNGCDGAPHSYPPFVTTAIDAVHAMVRWIAMDKNPNRPTFAPSHLEKKAD
jgi:hypothetical protein